MLPLEKLETILPPAELDRLALELEVNAPNQVRLTGQAVFLCLLNTLLNGPVVTLRLLEETFNQLFHRAADHSSFGKRLATLSPDFLEALYVRLYRRLEPETRDTRRPRVRRVDATTVTASAKLLAFGLFQRANGRAKNQTGKRHVKAVFELSEDGLPHLLRVCSTRSETNDNHALGNAMAAANTPGDLWIFDRGCKDRDRLLGLHQHGSYWLTPHCGQKVQVLTTVWESPETPAAAAGRRAADAAQAQTRPKTAAPYHLQRVEQVVFENGEDAEDPTQQAKWATQPVLMFHGERYNRRTGHWEAFVLLTNLPLSAGATHAGPYALAEVPELYRSRWDLEVFFKFVKQHLSYGHLTSYCENGICLMLWMVQIVALLLGWYQRETGIDRGWRSVKFWLADDTRAWTAAVLARSRTEAAGVRPRADGVPPPAVCAREA